MKHPLHSPVATFCTFRWAQHGFIPSKAIIMDDDYAIFKLWVCLSRRVRGEKMCIINLLELHAPLGTFTVGVKRVKNTPEREQQLYNLYNWDHLLWCGRWSLLKRFPALISCIIAHISLRFSSRFSIVATRVVKAIDDLWSSKNVIWANTLSAHGTILK